MAQEIDFMKLTIVTINRNNAEGLRQTLSSVARQTYQDFEYIIVDGASTDSSVEIVKELDAQPKSFAWNWISEPDTGIYNAMNKGVRMATGDYVLMLNSGDYLVDEQVLERILPELDGTDIVQGNTIRERNGKTYVERGYGRSDINFIDVQQGHFLHQASFCRRSLFERYGYFDESYRIGGDTVFYTKCLGFGNASFRYIDQNIAYFAPGGCSSDANGEWTTLRQQERHRIATELFSPRLWQTCVEYDKKGRLYDRLHRHKLIWWLTMLLARIAK